MPSISKRGISIIADEIGVDWHGNELEVNKKIKNISSRLKTQSNILQEDNFNSPVASGSVKAGGYDNSPVLYEGAVCCFLWFFFKSYWALTLMRCYAKRRGKHACNGAERDAFKQHTS